MKHVLTILIYLALVFGAAQQPAAGCTDAADYADLPSALAAATSCLEVPAGVYPVTATGGKWLNVTQPGLYISGHPGAVIRATGGVTLTSDLYLINVAAPGVTVEGLRLEIAGGYTGVREIGAIRVDAPADHVTVQGNEIAGGYTGNGGNGFGIGTYRLYNHPGSGAAQHVTIADNFIHDSPSTAIGVNSSYNTIRGNRIARIGTGPLQHAFYAQGGNNLYSGNYAEQVSGYCYHGWKKVPNLDGSGDRIIGNTFTACASGPGIVSGMPNQGNTALPVGANLSRDAIFQGNVFRGAGVLSVSIPSSIVSNVFEGTRLELAAGSDGSQAIGNRFSGFTLLGDPAIRISAPALVSGNTIDMNAYATGIDVRGNGAQIRDNRITRTASGTADWMVGIALNANDLTVSGNYLSLNGAQLLGVGTAPAGLRIHDNALLTTRFVMRDSVRIVSGLVYDNRWQGQFNNGAGLTFRDNDGAVT